mmetsp:Transcript_6480/g.5782  ORF Transcript_6480/g.5782 Transcript_6480/m.5782 type:complete len:184 (+) Transcript_6480:1472-2023(+)
MDDQSLSPMAALCAGCRNTAFYYFNCGFNLIVGGIFFVIATLIFYILVKNYSYNKTTFERMTKNPVQEETQFTEKVIEQYNFAVFYQDEMVKAEGKVSSNEEVEKALLQNEGEQELLEKVENLKVKGCGRNCKIMCCRRTHVPQHKLYQIYKKAFEEEKQRKEEEDGRKMSGLKMLLDSYEEF